MHRSSSVDHRLRITMDHLLQHLFGVWLGVVLLYGPCGCAITLNQTQQHLHAIQHQNVSSNLVSYEPLNLYSQMSPPVASSSSTTLSTTSASIGAASNSNTTSLPETAIEDGRVSQMMSPIEQISSSGGVPVKMYYTSDSIPPVAIASPPSECKGRCDSSATIIEPMEQPPTSFADLNLLPNETQYYTRVYTVRDSNYEANSAVQDEPSVEPNNSGFHSSRNSRSNTIGSFPAPLPNDHHSLPPETMQQLLRPSLSTEMLDDELDTIHQELIGGHHSTTDHILKNYLSKLKQQQQQQQQQQLQPITSEPMVTEPMIPFLNMDSFAPQMSASLPSKTQFPQSSMFALPSPSPPRETGGLFTRFIDRMYRSPPAFVTELSRPNKPQNGGGFLSNIFNFATSASNKLQQTLPPPNLPLTGVTLQTQLPTINYEPMPLFLNPQARPQSRLRMLMSRNRFGLGLGLTPMQENRLFPNEVFAKEQQFYSPNQAFFSGGDNGLEHTASLNAALRMQSTHQSQSMDSGPVGQSPSSDNSQGIYEQMQPPINGRVLANQGAHSFAFDNGPMLNLASSNQATHVEPPLPLPPLHQSHQSPPPLHSGGRMESSIERPMYPNNHFAPSLPPQTPTPLRHQIPSTPPPPIYLQQIQTKLPEPKQIIDAFIAKLKSMNTHQPQAQQSNYQPPQIRLGNGHFHFNTSSLTTTHGPYLNNTRVEAPNTLSVKPTIVSSRTIKVTTTKSTATGPLNAVLLANSETGKREQDTPHTTKPSPNSNGIIVPKKTVSKQTKSIKAKKKSKQTNKQSQTQIHKSSAPVVEDDMVRVTFGHHNNNHGYSVSDLERHPWKQSDGDEMELMRTVPLAEVPSSGLTTTTDGAPLPTPNTGTTDAAALEAINQVEAHFSDTTTTMTPPHPSN